MTADEAAPGAVPPRVPLLLRERVLLVGALAVVIGLSWAYLAWMARGMAGVGGATPAHCAAMPGMTSSSLAYLGWVFVMWAVMAVAMMLPTALPLVVLFQRFWRGRHRQLGSAVPTAQIALGYVAAWVAFGAVASVVQVGLEQVHVLSPVQAKLHSTTLAGLTLLGAGVFQLTPLKTACLSRCRSPLMFLMTRWRSGRAGAFLMGADHGLFCLGCCWALMLVMFVAGVMNLAWMAGLTLLMTLEKVVPHGGLLARAAGVALVAAGASALIVAA